MATLPLLASCLVNAASLEQDRDRFLDGSGRLGPAMKRIGPLRFSMGSEPTDPGYFPNQTRHPVELSAYSIGVYETTNREFCEFLNEEGNRGDGKIPWIQTDPHRGGAIRLAGKVFAAPAGKEEYPVVAVTWPGARAYCRWLSRKTGRAYDLPTAAQWEAAARAGTATAWPWGSTFNANAVRGRRPDAPEELARVGTLPPNAWGLHDMLGNAWEWVRDCFDIEFYRFSPLRDPLMSVPECLTPEIRGGSFRDGENFCRPGFRTSVGTATAQDGIGFRVGRAR